MLHRSTKSRAALPPLEKRSLKAKGKNIAKTALRTLVKAAASRGAAGSWPLDRLRGIAFYDSEQDVLITQLSSFDAARQAVSGIRDFIARFGAAEATRIVLQFVYGYFGRVESLRYERAAFEALWLDFAAEVKEASWMYRGIANIRNFTSQNLYLDLGDGITVRGRNFAELTALGFGGAVLE